MGRQVQTTIQLPSRGRRWLSCVWGGGRRVSKQRSQWGWQLRSLGGLFFPSFHSIRCHLRLVRIDQFKPWQIWSDRNVGGACACVSMCVSDLHYSEYVKNFSTCFTNEVISRISRADLSSGVAIMFPLTRLVSTHKRMPTSASMLSPPSVDETASWPDDLFWSVASGRSQMLSSSQVEGLRSNPIKSLQFYRSI